MLRPCCRTWQCLSLPPMPQHNVFANLFTGHAKSLRNACEITLAILGEAQRYEVVPAATVFSNAQTAVAIADPNQRLQPNKRYTNENPWSRDGQWGTLRNPDPQWVTDVLVHANSTALCTRLTLCKRCGPIATGFCQRICTFCHNFNSHDVAPSATLRFNFFTGQDRW